MKKSTKKRKDTLIVQLDEHTKMQSIIIKKIKKMINLNLEKMSNLVNKTNPKFAKDLRKKMKNKEHYTYCTYAGDREEIMKIFLKEFPKKIEYNENDGELYEIKYIGYCGHSNTLRFGVTKKVPFWMEAKTEYMEISNIKKFLVKMKHPRI